VGVRRIVDDPNDRNEPKNDVSEIERKFNLLGKTFWPTVPAKAPSLEALARSGAARLFLPNLMVWFLRAQELRNMRD